MPSSGQFWKRAKMDLIDMIDIPSFERRRDRLKRNIATLTGTLAILYALEKYNGSVTWAWKGVRK